MKRAHSVPPNLQFEINDAEDEWVFSQKFDFIHGRALITCFKDPAAVFRRAYDALAPGGYFEMQDAVFPLQSIGDLPTESAIYRWMQIIDEGSAKLGGRGITCSTINNGSKRLVLKT